MKARKLVYSILSGPAKGSKTISPKPGVFHGVAGIKLGKGGTNKRRVGKGATTIVRGQYKLVDTRKSKKR